MLFHLFNYLDGTFLGGSGGELYLADNKPLILIRQEGCGQLKKEISHCCNDSGVHHKVADRFCE